MRNRKLLAWQSVLAGLQVMAGAAAMADIIGEKWFGLFVVGLGALQVGTATWVHGLVTPVPVADPPRVRIDVPEPRLSDAVAQEIRRAGRERRLERGPQL